jgi:hypothetical protein
LGDRTLEIGRSLDRREGDRREASTLDETPAMLIQLTVFVPAVIAIYAATGAWVFSCDPISKTGDIVRGGLYIRLDRRFVHVRAGTRFSLLTAAANASSIVKQPFSR